MRFLGGCATFLFATCLAPGVVDAQSIAITPSSPAVVLGQTLQLTATVTGLTNTSVTWSVAGVVGGNAANGTISPSGLYTAPATQPANSPQITARSVSNPTVKSSVYVYLENPGPTITSVSPSPIPAGTSTITVTGSGFQPYATIFAGGVQLVSTVSGNTISGSVYYGASTTSTTVCVKNPGSVCGNSLTVPVGNPPTPHALAVVNGTGSGSYLPGTVVTITANAAPAGQQFLNWTGGGSNIASSTASTTTITMGKSNLTVTATYTSTTPSTYVLSVVNGTGGGTYTAATVVTITANAAPAGQAFTNWTGASVTNANAASTTLTMPAANATVTANYVAVSGPIPFPVSTHPRLWITPNDIPRLQSWATSSNAVYQQGLLPVLHTAVSLYQTAFFPNGVANPNYPDPGDTQGYTGYLTEEYGAILALNSLIDPNPANRIQYAQYARNMLMYAMNQAALGTLANAPFRDSMFATYNRASASGDLWPLMVDWLYNAQDSFGNPILTASDKATIRNVFMMWAAACETASTTGGDSPSPAGVINSLQLLPGNLPYRMAANNYYTAHARLMTMMALAIDPADDPPVNAGVSASALGNSLRSYLSDALGAWLYQQYAMYADPSTASAAYGIPGSGAGFGLASGGLPPEGMLYGVSYGNLLEGLLALQTAGFNNPAYAAYTGPQIGLIGAPMWDRYVKGMITSLIPAPFTPTQPGESYLGQTYQFGSYGDLLRLYATPDYIGPFALLALLEQQQGQSTHVGIARWFGYNVLQGGPAAFYTRMTDPYTFGDTILHFLLYDPAVAPSSIADPRPGWPTMFVDPGAGRIVAHTDWTPTGTMFDYRSSWESINHQDGNAGQFELYRKGEWLTKELSNYDNNGLGMTTYYHNTLGLQNTSPSGTPQVSWFETGELANGSQWMLGMNAGDPVNHFSSGSGYVYANTDMINLYNRPSIWTPSNALMNITQATRSLLWLNGDSVVIYDRATSQSAGLFKRWNLTLVTSPNISGHTATEVLPSGQQLFVQSLLPASSTIVSRNVVADLTTIAELEPSKYVMTVQDPSNPTDTRFLHVLQGADAGAAMVPATYLQSVSGTAFDGAVFGSNAVYFPVSATAAFTATAFSAPAGVHTLMVAGLAPNASYTVTVQANGSGNLVTVTPGGSTTADAAGLLQVAF